ncbi:MAG: glycosyltransferase family 4 protein [Acidobacteriota bacterium]|nr:glycosyltransferase family 4 protein [Acidobacteriota bacterium]
MSRKVVLLGPLPPPFGGVSVYMSFLLEHFQSPRVGVWAYFGGPFGGEPGVRLFRHRRLGLVPLALKEGRAARVLDATHFHLEHPNPLLLGAWLACKLVLRFRWYKNILDGSLPSRHREFTPLRRLLFRLAVAGADEFVVVSDELRRWLQDEIKVTQKVTVIPCLVPVPRRHLDGPLPEATEQELRPYLRRPRRVCSVGSFIADYGFADAARAVERLRAETGEDLGLLLLDGAFARDEAYRAGVLKGREWITVLEDVPNPEVYKILRRSDAFVRAVVREGYGISRVEAAWCGLPVVATNVGETRGMLTYEFGDVEALTRRLRRALYDPAARDVGRWAEQFRREAEGNLRSLREVLGLE